MGLYLTHKGVFNNVFIDIHMLSQPWQKNPSGIGGLHQAMIY